MDVVQKKTKEANKNVIYREIVRSSLDSRLDVFYGRLVIVDFVYHKYRPQIGRWFSPERKGDGHTLFFLCVWQIQIIKLA